LFQIASQKQINVIIIEKEGRRKNDKSWFLQKRGRFPKEIKIYI